MTARLDLFEKKVHGALAAMLAAKGLIDMHLPDAPDIEGRWEGICMAYLPDGVREFQQYPTVSLGWMMFIGMAVAKWWDEDWEMYSRFNDFYAILKKGRGYDAMDDYILENILKLPSAQAGAVSDVARAVAAHVHGMLMHEGFEPGTPEAFNAYVRCLHQLYYYGAAMELRRLGYHMTRM